MPGGSFGIVGNGLEMDSKRTYYGPHLLISDYDRILYLLRSLSHYTAVH